MNNLPATADGYRDVIVRAAQDPNFDVDKLERLVAMQEAQELRAGDRAFNEALSAAEAEMTVISTNANNPQTRSNYATFARLDGAIRPIYTKHGFGISFNTEPSGEPNLVRVVGMLSNGMIARRFQIDMPIVTQGIKGTDMMTRTHATMSANSYGKRALLIGMFNLAIGDDDDGNRAGGGSGRRAPPPPTQPRQPQQPQPFELVDPVTGEVITDPSLIPITGDDYRPWGEKFIGALNNLAKSIDEVDRWIELNHDTMEKMRNAKPPMFEALLRAIGTSKQRFLDPQ